LSIKRTPLYPILTVSNSSFNQEIKETKQVSNNPFKLYRWFHLLIILLLCLFRLLYVFKGKVATGRVDCCVIFLLHIIFRFINQIFLKLMLSSSLTW
jgi:hypothetical protein